jgi:hypothetical protein
LLYQKQDVFDAFDEGDGQQNGINDQDVEFAEGQLAAWSSQWSAP